MNRALNQKGGGVTICFAISWSHTEFWPGDSIPTKDPSVVLHGLKASEAMAIDLNAVLDKHSSSHKSPKRSRAFSFSSYHGDLVVGRIPKAGWTGVFSHNRSDRLIPDQSIIKSVRCWLQGLWSHNMQGHYCLRWRYWNNGIVGKAQHTGHIAIYLLSPLLNPNSVYS